MLTWDCYLSHLRIISACNQAWLRGTQKCFLNEYMKIDYCDIVFFIPASHCCFLSNKIWKWNTDILLNKSVEEYASFDLFFFFLNINLFIYFWLPWVFVAAHGPSPAVASEDHSSLRCMGFSLWWPLPLRSRAPGVWASVVVAHGLSSCGSRSLERRLSSREAQAQLLQGMWDPPGPGIESASSAWAGGFPTTAPSGKPLILFLFRNNCLYAHRYICLKAQEKVLKDTHQTVFTI